MAVRTPSAMEGNTSPISSTALAGFDSPPMSRHTTPSAPASEFGNLALGSGSSGSSGRRMAPVTRSASRRAGNVSQSSQSRVTAGPSRRSQVQAGAGSSRRQGSRRPVPEDDDDDSDDSDGSSDSDGSDDHEGDPDQARLRQYAQQYANVYDLFALSDPDYLTGQELIANDHLSTDSATHRRIATAVAAEVRTSPTLYRALMGIAQVPGPDWAQRIHDRLERRLEDITRQLALNVHNPTMGRDVIDTAARLRSLVAAVNNVTSDRYLNHMRTGTRRDFAALLLRTLQYVVGMDRDAYQNSPVPRPAYAGQTTEDRNLYRRLCVNQSGQVFLVDVLYRLDPNGQLLSSGTYAAAIARVYSDVMEKHTVRSGDGGHTERSSPQPPQSFMATLGQLYRPAYYVLNPDARGQ